MKFRTFVECCKMMPAWKSVIGKGDHGIGKSQVVYQLAEHFNLKVVERRLSQLSEGDIIGLPVLDGGVTKFLPADWYMEACREPRLLFLDEFNRATPEVMQAGFQIVLDRTLNGHKLHPETRVYAMVNTNARYNVNAMDAALQDRFWNVELDPDVEDWLAWAQDRGKINECVIDFVKTNPKWLDTCGRDVDYEKVHPSRRSWEHLSKILEHNNLFEGPDKEVFWALSVGMIGNEAASQFQDFVKNMDRQVSAEDILNNCQKILPKIKKLGQERWNICIDKLAEYVQKNDLTDEQGANLKHFVKVLPGELKVSLWGKLVQGGVQRIANAKTIHKHISEDILAVFGAGKQGEKAAGGDTGEESPKETPDLAGTAPKKTAKKK